MSIPKDLDLYTGYLALDEDQLREEEKLPEDTISRVIRFRSLYTYWCRFSSKSLREMVEWDMLQHHVKETQAYDDMHCVQVIMGNLQESSKKFHRWRVNQMIEEDRKAAKRAGDHRAVASMQKNYIKNNLTDKEDTPDLAFDKILPLPIELTTDPSTVTGKKLPNLKRQIAKFNKMFGGDIEYTEYEEVKEKEEE